MFVFLVIACHSFIMYINRAVYKLCKLYKSSNFYTITKCTEINIIKSKSPPLVIPKQLIQDYIWKDLDKWYSKPAVVCFETGKSYTFGEIYVKSGNLAGVLRQRFHLNVGDTVAVILPNVVDFPIAFLGAIQAGLIVTTVNPFFTSDEMAMQLKDSNSKLIFTTKEIVTVINCATYRLRRKIPLVLAETNTVDLLPSNCVKLSELCEIENRNRLELDPGDVALLPYSSGTTGLFKGVQLTHTNVVSNLYQMSSPDFIVNLETQEAFQDVIPVFLPLFHIYGMVGIFLNFFAQGCKLVMIPNFVGSQFIKLLRLHQPTLIFAVPSIIVIILNNSKLKYDDLKSIRCIISAAAPLGTLAVEKFTEKTKNEISLLQMYGMTETSPLTLVQSTKLKSGRKIGGSGLLLPNTEAKVIPIDSTTPLALGANQPGELLVRGPQVMKGYHNNPVATQEAISADGWLKTGDICFYDEDEHFFITDRLKEMIKVKGFQVAPAELEEILKSHFAVEDAAVVGIPHPVQGEAPKAFIVLRSGMIVRPEAIRDFVASKVATYKRLVGGVVIMDAIPRNAAGKILRKELRQL